MFNNVSVESETSANNNVNVSSSDHPFQTFFTSIGGGIRFNLGPRIDSFAQYEYNVANRDIIDGDFLGELFELNGSAKTSNSWSVVSVGIQFKFGSSDVDPDWPTPLLPLDQSPYVNRDVFEEFESRLLARQEEQVELLNEQINQLTSQIDSLKAELESQQQSERSSEQIHADTVEVFLARIESLEQEIANEREKSEQNQQKVDALTNQLESLRTDLTQEQQARREQERFYENTVAELQTHIDSLENELTQIRTSDQIGQAAIDTSATDTEPDDPETEPAEEDTSPAERREDREPETVGRKDVESSSEIADTLATEEEQPTELADDDVDTEDDVDEELADEPESVSEEPEETTEPSIAEADPDTVEDDEDIVTDTEPEPEETEEADADEDNRGVSWLIYTLIALLVAAVIYFLSKMFASTEDDDNQSGSDDNKGGGSPSPTSTAPDSDPGTEKPADKDSTTYPVPEHSRTIERKKSDSKSRADKSESKSASASPASEAIPEHSITVDSKSKQSKSDPKKADLNSKQNIQKDTSNSKKKDDFASRGYLSMTLNEISDYLNSLFPKKTSDNQ